MLQLVRRNKQKTTFTPYKKKNYKDSIWIEDLNVKPETIKFLEKNHKRYLCNFESGIDFLERTLKATTKFYLKIDKLDFVKK